jgi:putative membrane protein
MRRAIGIVVAVIIVVIGLSFAMLNHGDATLNYYLGQATMPLSLWMIIALILGAVAGALSTIGVVARQRRELSRLRRRVDETQRELSELRKLPIRNAP